MAEVKKITALLSLNPAGWVAGLKTAEAKMERFGTQMFFMGSRISAAVTVPMTLLTKSIVKVGAGFDQAMTESLAIINDVTPQIRHQMENTAKQIALQTKYSATEAAEAYFFLASSGLSAAETMNALPIVAKFAQAGVINLAQATELLSDAYITLGLKTGPPLEQMRNMQRVADVLTEANNMAQGSIVEFSEALTNKAGVAMRVFGISVEEGVAALAAFAERGIKGKLAGQQLFIVIRDLQRAVLKNREEWERLAGPGAVFDETTGELRNLADIIGTLEVALEGLSDRQTKATLDLLGFQERSLQATLTLIGVSDRMREFQEAFFAAGGVVDRVANNQMQSFINQMHLVKERISQAAIEIFDTFRPAFEQVIIPKVLQAIEVLERFVDWLGTLSVKTRSTMLVTTAFVAALGPLLAAFGGWILLMKPIVTMLSPLWRTLGIVGGAADTAAGSIIGLSTRLTSLTGFLVRGLGPASAFYVGLNLIYEAINRLFPRVGSLSALILENGEAIGITAKNLRELVDTYNDLSIIGPLTEAQSKKMAGAEMVLAEMLGITTEALRAEWEAGNRVKDLFEEQIATLEKLESAELDRMSRAISGIHAHIAALEAEQLALAQGGDVSIDQIGKWALLGKFIAEEIRGIWVGVRVVMDSFSNLGEMGSMSLDLLITHGHAVGGIFGAIATAIDGIRSAWDSFWSMLRREVKIAEQTNIGFEMFLGDDVAGLDEAALHRQRELSEQLSEQRLELARLTADLNAKNMELGRGFTDLDKPMRSTVETAGKLGEELEGVSDGFDSSIQNTSAFRKKVDELATRLAGMGTTKLPVLVAAFKSLTDEQRASTVTARELWKVYKPIRATLAPGALPADIERVTTALREQEEHVKFLTTDAGKFVSAMRDVDTELQDIWTNQDKVNEAWSQMNGHMSDDFFEEHGETIGELNLRYGHLAKGSMRDLIDAYIEWGMEAGRTSEKVQKAARKSKKFIQESFEDMGAELKSKQAELAIFSLNTADAELVGLKKGMEERRLAHSRMILDMWKNYTEAFTNMSDQERENARSSIVVTEAWGKQIIKDEEAIGLLRLMKARGFSQRRLEQIAKLGNDEKQLLIEKNEELLAIMRRFWDQLAAGSGIASFLQELGGAFASIGAMMQSLITDADSFGKSREAWAANESGAARFTSALGMATSAYAAFNKIAGIQGRGKRAAAGAATGAQMGSAFGPIGTAIGAGIGAVVGAVMDDPGWAKIQDAIATQFDTHITEELAKKIEETSEEIGSDWGAMMLHLNDIIKSSGGVTAANVDHWTQQVRDAFSLTEFGALDLSGAAKVLDDNFGDLVASGTLSSGVLKANVAELIRLDEEFGTASEAVREFKSAMMDMAIDGLGKVAAGNKLLQDSLIEGNKKRVEEVKLIHEQETEERVAEVRKQGKRLKLTEEAIQVEIDKVRSDAARRWKAMSHNMANDFKNNFQDKTKQGYRDLADFTELTFLAMSADGVSFLDALTALEPSLDTLATQMEVTGQNGSAAIAELLRIREFKTANEGLMLQIQGMNELMVGLGNAGHLTQTSFERFGVAASTQFQRIIDAGGSSNDALLLMAPSLQSIKDLQEQYGFTVDESTQKLIDLGVEHGYVGERAMTADEMMVAGMRAVAIGIGSLITLLGGDVPQAIRDMEKEFQTDAEKMANHSANLEKEVDSDFKQMQEAAKFHMGGLESDVGSAASEAAKHFEKLQRDANYELSLIKTDIDVNLNADLNVGNIDWSSGGNFQLEVTPFAKGGIIDRPTLSMIGEGGKPEMVGPVSFMTEALKGAMNRTDRTDTAVVSELKSLRDDMELLPIHIRDAMMTSQ
jgi:TP901 family phage tail tape measure protein